MLEADVGAGTGAVGVPREHPRPSRLHARARAPDPPRRTGRRAGADRAGGARRGARHRDRPRLRLDRAPVGHGLLVRRSRRRSGTAPTARPMAGVEIRLVDDDGAPVASGAAGEIWSRGPDLCVGYTDPALTADDVRRRRLVPQRRHGRPRRRRLPHDHRPGEGRDHPRRREHLGRRDRGRRRARCRRSPRSRSSPRPTNGSASTRARSCGSRPAPTSIELSRHHRRARADRPGPPEVARGAADRRRLSRAPPSGKVRKVDLRRAVARRRPVTAA